MNIIDLPPELFELILKDNVFPHIILINNSYDCVINIDIDVAYEILSNLCHVNNRKLILHYFSYNNETFLYKQLGTNMQYGCIIHKQFNTLKWFIINNIFTNDDTIIDIISFAKKKTLTLLKWMYRNKLLNMCTTDIEIIIITNKINIIKWLISINYGFTQDNIDYAIDYNRLKIANLLIG